MIRGVNKQIVEINYTHNDYIEKAILIINPQKSTLPAPLIRQKASQYMQNVQQEVHPARLPDSLSPQTLSTLSARRKKRTFLLFLFLLLFAGLSLTAAVFIFFF